MFSFTLALLRAAVCFLAFSTGTARTSSHQEQLPIPPLLGQEPPPLPSSCKARIGVASEPATSTEHLPRGYSVLLPPARIAAMNNDGVAADDDYRGAAARRGGGGFPGVRNLRFRAALYFAAWGVAGIMSTTVPNLAANPDHVMVYFLLLMAAVILLLLSMAAVDLPWLERAAARLEGLLSDMF